MVKSLGVHVGEVRRESAQTFVRAPGGRGMWWIYLYIRWRVVRDGRERVGEGELLAARALYYIIGGHFGPPKLLSEHKKYEVLLGPPFFRAASGAALPVRTATEKGGARRRESKTPACI